MFRAAAPNMGFTYFDLLPDKCGMTHTASNVLYPLVAVNLDRGDDAFVNLVGLQAEKYNCGRKLKYKRREERHRKYYSPH